MIDSHVPHSFRPGDGATLLMWSDRHAGTIVSAQEKRVYWQRDEATRTDANGMSEMQSYDYTPNRLATPEVFTLRANGTWVRKGEGFRTGTRLVPGRHEYHDYSF